MPKSASALWPSIAMVFVSSMWGISFLSTKVLLRDLTPMTVAFTRFLVASLVLWVCLWRLEPGSRLARADAGLMAITGFLGTTLYFVCENTGIKLTSASNAVLIISVLPALGMAADTLLRGHRPGALTSAGVVLSIAGVAVVVGPQSVSLGRSAALGNALVLVAAVVWVAFNEVARPLMARYSKLALTAYSTWFGTLFLLPLALAQAGRLHVPTVAECGHLAFLALVCSALCYFLYMYALGNLSITATTSFLNIMPVVGVAGSVLFLHEAFTLTQAVGGVVIVAGITMAAVSENSTPRRSAVASSEAA